MPYKLKRIPTVTNTFSGALGEARIAAELIRCGIKVAKPYWNDDEMDLLAFLNIGEQVVPLPIQVKSRQFLKGEDKVFIPIKKQYIAKNEGLCLLLYFPQDDSIWLINGKRNIIQAYDAQFSWNPKHTMFSAIHKDGTVGFAFFRAHTGFDTYWKIDKSDVSDISRRFCAVAKAILGHNKRVRGLQAFWTFG